MFKKNLILIVILMSVFCIQAFKPPPPPKPHKLYIYSWYCSQSELENNVTMKIFQYTYDYLQNRHVYTGVSRIGVGGGDSPIEIAPQTAYGQMFMNGSDMAAYVVYIYKNGIHCETLKLYMDEHLFIHRSALIVVPSHCC